eukprot:4132699-Pyramimonas_sp.AAC.1
MWENSRRLQGADLGGQLRRDMFLKRTQLSTFKREAREEWVNNTIAELQKSIARADLGYFYKLLKKTGVHAHGKSRRGQGPCAAEEAANFVKGVMGDDVGE